MGKNISFKDCSIETLGIIAKQLQSSFETALGSDSYSDSISGIKEQCKRLLCRSQERKSKAFMIIVVVLLPLLIEIAVGFIAGFILKKQNFQF